MGDAALNYQEFIASKLTAALPTGLQDTEFYFHASLFDMQVDLCTWALRRGRAAIFADTGLGKSRMQVSWAQQIAKHAGVNVMILAPLAVAQQTVEEGAKIGITINRCREPGDVKPGINITNYDRIHKFDCKQFGAVVLDESSCIKHHTAKTLQLLMDLFAHCAYKLCATATPAPNDWTELGTHAEFLGVCTRTEMLSEFFVHDGGETQTWRLKGHARGAFWRWVASWGAMIRKPSDLGYNDDAYALPPMHVVDHLVGADEDAVKTEGMLFALEASTMSERREAKKASLDQRVNSCVLLIKSECVKLAENSQKDAQNAVEERVCGEQEEKGCGGRRIQAEKESAVVLGQGCEKGVHEEVLQGKPGEVQAERRFTRSEECSKESTVCRGRNPSRENEAGIKEVAIEEPGQSQTQATNVCVRDYSGSVQRDACKAESCVCNLRDDRSEQPEGIPPCGSLPCNREDSWDFVLELQHGAGKIQRRHQSPVFGDLVPTEPWVIWCELNSEHDMLEKLLGNLAFSVRGSMTTEEKEYALMAWKRGDRPFMISKPSVTGWGLNWQHCRNTAFVGVTDSFEAYYQAIRRFWRFGQTGEVYVHRFASQLESAILRNLERKQSDAIKMGEQLAAETRDAVMSQIKGAVRTTNNYNALKPVKAPDWLKTEI